jgi:hypothetical protein|eukprot:COSAG01_NODE_1443_length_10286_cov_7.093649_10_plen_44_part_00
MLRTRSVINQQSRRHTAAEAQRVAQHLPGRFHILNFVTRTGVT